MLHKLVHMEARGCALDMVMRKSDIRYGMRAGALCAECSSALAQYGVPPNHLAAIRRMLALVRDEALGMSRPLDPMAVFVVMRFSSFDENANAYEYGVKTGIESAGLSCRRADDEYSAGTLLSKVTGSIERARVVIVKVDSPNLNVYYELGVAQALQKDIILIAEQDLINQLPTDINNLECIAYVKGDYRGLASLVWSALVPFTPRS